MKWTSEFYPEHAVEIENIVKFDVFKNIFQAICRFKIAS